MFVQLFQSKWVPAAALGAAAWLSAASAGRAAPILSVDFDSRASTSATKTPPGWVNWELTEVTSAATRSYGPLSVAVTVFDANGGGVGNMDDRDRDPPNTDAYLVEMYDDFVFAGSGSSGITGGLDVVIDDSADTQLLPNTQYLVSLWAVDYDHLVAAGVPAPKAADWYDATVDPALASPLFRTEFERGDPIPDDDGDYRWQAVVTTDAAGAIVLKGRGVSGTGANPVIVNGLQISPVPEPASLAVLGLGGAALLGRRRARRGSGSTR